MRTLLERMIDATMRCLKCGTPGIGTCSCWERCSCGWTAEAGKPCGNQVTRRCSTKLRYGKYNRRTKRYE